MRGIAVENESTSGIDPERLARLLAVGAENAGPETSDLPDQAMAGLLRARLAGPLPLDGAVVDSLPAILGRPCQELMVLAGRTLGEVLLDPKADPDVIEAIKDYGKALGTRWPEGPEHAVAITIYYGGIAAAMVFHDHKITAHSYEKLGTAFGKLIEKPWMLPEVARLLSKAQDVCRRRMK